MLRSYATTHPYEYARNVRRRPVRQSGNEDVSAEDPPENVLSSLKAELMLANDNGLMLTFDVKKRGWVEWSRPIRIFSNGGMTQVAARAFRSVEHLEPVICPHALNPFRSKDETTMKLHLDQVRLRGGRKEDFFRAGHPGCEFHVVVPRLAAPMSRVFQRQPLEEYILSAPSLLELDERSFEMSYDTDVSISPTKSISSTVAVEGLCLRLSPSPTPSLAGRSLAGPSTTMIKHSGKEEAVRPRPRPRPLTRNAPLSQSWSYFDRKTAESRSQPDLDLIIELLENERKGVYIDNPTLHPAWDGIKTCLVLEPYDHRIYPMCANRTFSNLEYFTSNLGLAIRELNTTHGILSATFRELLAENTECLACHCMYSFSGYHGHRTGDGFCQNTPGSVIVPAKFSPLEDLRSPKLILRSFPQGSSPLVPTELLDTPIAIPYLEWNSKIGIPRDVWVMVSTAVICCSTCHLFRTYPADRAHRNDDGDCLDIGQAIGSIAKGKGKAREASLTPESSDDGFEFLT